MLLKEVKTPSSSNLFINMLDEYKPKIKKALGNCTFAAWDDLTITDGVVSTHSIPLSQFKFVFLGAVGDNEFIYTSTLEYLKDNSAKYLSYGCSQNINNKLRQSVLMKKAGVAQINTVVVNTDTVTAASLIKQLDLPIISKIIDGSKGKGIKKHDTKEELQAFLSKNKDSAFIFQEFIPNDGDYRVFFLKDKLIYTVKRTSGRKSEFRNNTSLGGTSSDVVLPTEALSLATSANIIMGFDVTGVDIIQHKDTGKWFVMEINSAPQFNGNHVDDVITAIVDLIKH